MNRPDFNELVAALKGGSSKGVEFKPAKPGVRNSCTPSPLRYALTKKPIGSGTIM
jgi:hypothetical protein